MENSFLEKLALHLLKHYEGKTADIAIVFPNKRANLFFRNSLSKHLNKPLWVPKIYGIEEFLENISGLKIINNLDILFEFYHIYRSIEHEKAQPFGEFSHWAQVLLHDFNELDQQHTNTADFFSYLHEIRKIESWNSGDTELTPLQKNYIDFWKKARVYYDALQEHLTSQGKAYNGLAARIASDNIDLYIGDGLQLQKILFAGFNALSRSEENIINKLLNAGKAEVLWDADEYYMKDKNQEAGMFLRQYREKWNKDSFHWISREMTEKKKKIEVIGVAQNIGQAKVAGSLLRQMNNVEELQHTAVVLADENLLKPVLQSLPGTCNEVNVTMGNSLVNAAVSGLFESLIQLYISRSSKGFYHADLLRLFRQTHFNFLFTETEREICTSFTKQIETHNLVFIQVSDFPEELISNEFIKGITGISSTAELLLLIKELILRLKENFLGYENRDSKIELEYLLSFYQLVNRLIDLTTKYPFVDSFQTLKSLIKSSLTIEKLDFKGEPLSGLQIMGMLETRNLDFETVILLSANEGIIPAGKSQHTFIPYDVKKKYHMPSFREKDAMFAYHFYRLLQKAKHICLVYNTETDEFGSGEKSRFITQLKDEFSKHKNVEWSESIAVTPVRATRKAEVVIHKNEALIEKAKAYFKRGISPTSISSYINCPLDFYYNYLLELKEEEMVEETIEANSLGSVIHEVLENLYSPYENTKVGPEDVKIMLSKAPTLAKQTFLRNFSEENLKYGKNFLSLEVASSYLAEYLKKELNLISDPKVNLILRATESKLVHEIELTTPQDEKISAKLIGKIDRIDEFNGNTRIIDYKSGKVDKWDLTPTTVDQLFTSKYGSKALQVMMYAFLHYRTNPSTKLQSGVVSFRHLSEGFINLSFSGNNYPEEQDYDTFEFELKNKLLEILDPAMPFRHNEDSAYCRFCD